MFCVSTSVQDHRASMESEDKFSELFLFFHCEFWDSNSGTHDFQDRHFYPVSNPGSPEVMYLL